MSVTRPGFHETLRQAREKADQQPEVMALLLNLPTEEYLALEAGERFPDDETLRRLCLMLEWNYYETRRAINNTATLSRTEKAPGAAEQPDSPAPMGATNLRPAPVAATGPKNTAPKNTAPKKPPVRNDTLGQRLREVREQTGQTVEILAMLLGLSEEDYVRLEAGEPPEDDLLRKISMVYDWNFLDLKAVLRSEQAGVLQPRRHIAPVGGASAHSVRLKTLLHDLESAFPNLGAKEQEMALAQMELVLETIRRQSSRGQNLSRPA